MNNTLETFLQQKAWTLYERSWADTELLKVVAPNVVSHALLSLAGF